jgi:membrane associated rhomboid family serine protease
MKHLSPAVLGLLAVNIATFVVGIFSSEAREWLVLHGAFWFGESERFGPWQWVTYLFLHGGPGHILLNMFALVSFGVLLERQWGTRRFLIFYFLCGVGAALVHNGVNEYHFRALQERLLAGGFTLEEITTMLHTGSGALPGDAALRDTLVELYRVYAVPMIGASGAIYGVLVAFGLLYPNAKLMVFLIPVPIAAKIVIPVLLALDLLSGITGISLFGGGIAHFAHLGGALIGFVLMLLWRKRTNPAYGQRFS